MMGPRRALDLACLSSAGGETFPLVRGEAMACGVPCAATDVADVRVLVGDAGRIVPPRDPVWLASAMADVLARPAAERERLGMIARRRIETCYSLPRIVGWYATRHLQLTTRMRTDALPSVAR
jgi:glycosyltransferase involved in cell wall biosynthesis